MKYEKRKRVCTPTAATIRFCASQSNHRSTEEARIFLRWPIIQVDGSHITVGVPGCAVCLTLDQYKALRKKAIGAPNRATR